MAKTLLDESTLVSIAKQAALRTTAPDAIQSILYAYDEDKVLSVEDHNSLLNFIHESSLHWQKPKSNSDLISEMLKKVGYGPRKYSGPALNKKELIAIHNWVMNPSRK
jgi:hypothetical protein